MKKTAKILIADDSSFMRKVLKDILAEAGFENFIECEDGKECLEKYKSEKPDLILLDIIMPGLDGIEVIKQIGKEAKIIVISAVGQEKMIEEAKSYGAKDYIVKPFDKEDVIAKVKKVI